LIPLIAETVGEEGDCYKLDNGGNVVWMSDADINSRYAYFWEGMPYPFNVRRYSKALVISEGPHYWDLATIMDWLRWYDKKNIWGD
jgi:hypothetical protein